MVNYKVILASNSPRRKELLAGIDIPFEVRVLEGIDESYPADLPTKDIAGYISQKKADAYATVEWTGVQLQKGTNAVRIVTPQGEVSADWTVK